MSIEVIKHKHIRRLFGENEAASSGELTISQLGVALLNMINRRHRENEKPELEVNAASILSAGLQVKAYSFRSMTTVVFNNEPVPLRPVIHHNHNPENE